MFRIAVRWLFILFVCLTAKIMEEMYRRIVIELVNWLKGTVEEERNRERGMPRMTLFLGTEKNKT